MAHGACQALRAVASTKGMEGSRRKAAGRRKSAQDHAIGWNDGVAIGRLFFVLCWIVLEEFGHRFLNFLGIFGGLIGDGVSGDAAPDELLCGRVHQIHFQCADVEGVFLDLRDAAAEAPAAWADSRGGMLLGDAGAVGDQDVRILLDELEATGDHLGVNGGDDALVHEGIAGGVVRLGPGVGVVAGEIGDVVVPIHVDLLCRGGCGEKEDGEKQAGGATFHFFVSFHSEGASAKASAARSPGR